MFDSGAVGQGILLPDAKALRDYGGGKLRLLRAYQVQRTA
jgi:hypothetical protein